MKPLTTYYYRVAAVGFSGEVGPFSKTVKAMTGRNTQISTAAFLGIDNNTQGKWAGKYGSDGFILTRYFFGRNCQVWPSYLSAVD